MMRRLIFVVAAGALALGAMACGDEDSADPTNTPRSGSPTTVAGATATPDAEPTVAGTPGGDETGIASVDAILRAVRAKDYAALAAMVRFEPVACTEAQGAGGPPKCRTGEPEGTPVEVVQVLSCEGFFEREGELKLDQPGYGTASGLVYGVYGVEDSQLLELWPDAQYAIVLYRANENDFSSTLLADGEGIVGINDGCGETPAQWVSAQGLIDVILAPE